MWVSVIIKGLIIGFVAAAPPGPSGVLVISRTLDKGRRYGYLTGLGISLSDMVYIICSIVGLSFLIDLVYRPGTSLYCHLIGSALLIVFGIVSRSSKKNPLDKPRMPKEEKPSLSYAYFSGFLVAIVNPMVIFIYMALFAYLRLPLSEMTGALQVCGFLAVVAGDFLWWTFISRLVGRAKRHFDINVIIMVKRILGDVLIASGVVWLAYTLINHWIC